MHVNMQLHLPTLEHCYTIYLLMLTNIKMSATLLMCLTMIIQITRRITSIVLVVLVVPVKWELPSPFSPLIVSLLNILL